MLVNWKLAYATCSYTCSPRDLRGQAMAGVILTDMPRGGFSFELCKRLAVLIVCTRAERQRERDSISTVHMKLT